MCVQIKFPAPRNPAFPPPAQGNGDGRVSPKRLSNSYRLLWRNLLHPPCTFVRSVLERVRKMGGTDDSPVLVGDSPTGRTRPQLRRSDLFVADGSRPAKSPVGAAPPAPMPLLRSFDFLPFAIYKYAAPLGLGKVTLGLSSMAASQRPVLPKKRI